LTRNNETIYYRLQQTDKDGKQQFICRTLKVSTTGKAQVFGNGYPNPVSQLLTIDIRQSFTGKADVQVINALGQVLRQQSFQLQPADNQLQIKMDNLNPGVYTIRISTNQGVQVQQVTKM
jgi:hypothetical protein